MSEFWMDKDFGTGANGKRQVTRFTPRGWVWCSSCGEQLNYQYGSIRWQCASDDLCPSCAGKKDANELIAKFRQTLRRI